jgi:hypothetical protein
MGQPTLQTTGFLFIAMAVLILSARMLSSPKFGKAAAYSGILAGILSAADYFLGIFDPATANALLMVGILVWVAWWVLIGIMLLRLGGIGG